jgi:hypothetical protein
VLIQLPPCEAFLQNLYLAKLGECVCLDKKLHLIGAGLLAEVPVDDLIILVIQKIRVKKPIFFNPLGADVLLLSSAPLLALLRKAQQVLTLHSHSTCLQTAVPQTARYPHRLCYEIPQQERPL